MCRVYNTIGSLTTLKAQLKESNISTFKSLKEVIDFQSSFATTRQQLISHHKNLIEEEKNLLKTELQSLEATIETQREQTKQKLTAEIEILKQQLNMLTNDASGNIFQKLAREFRRWDYKKNIKTKEHNFPIELKNSTSTFVARYQTKNNRYQFIISNSDEATRQSAQISLSELERKKTIIDNLNSFIYGALGEQKVVKTLENLSDEYLLINDFSVSLSPAMYTSNENAYIKSVQIDHILIGPSGVFLIETKNWSEKSLENLSLRSPVEQIRRTSFVLFMLLNNEMGKYHLSLERHHWGDKKISVKNLIVMTNTKPREEFQYVKILTLEELLGYITYFKPIFSLNETQKIADFIVKINEQKVIRTK